MADKYTIKDYIIEQLPQIEGYGNCGQVFKDKIPNHATFKDSIRTDHEGDIGIWKISEKDNKELKFCTLTESEIQIVVNAIRGDVDGCEEYLRSLFNNLYNSKGNDKIKISSCNKINLRTVGKNSSGIHWGVLNILIKYRIV